MTSTEHQRVMNQLLAKIRKQKNKKIPRSFHRSLSILWSIQKSLQAIRFTVET